MRLTAIIIVFCLAVLLAAGLSPAATFYVDPSADSDSGDGSKAHPWRTLSAIARNGTLRNKVSGGDTVLLASGYHGDVRISGKNAEPITIAAADGAKPRLSRLWLDGEKWTVRGLTISPAFADKPYDGTIVTFGEGGPSSELVIEDCFVYTAIDSSEWDAEKWKAANNGVTMGRHGKKLILRNNYILNTRFGVAMCAPESVCEGNVIDRFSGDGIRVTRDDLTVRGNVIKNNFVSAADGDDNHDDAIQCFLFNKGTGTVRRATIVGNIIINRESDELPLRNTLQAIGFFDGPLVEFVVTDNVICTDHYHGISLYDARGCRIERNAVWSRWSTGRRPWIQLGGSGRDNVVKDNVACQYKIDQPGAVDENNGPCTKRAYEQALKKLYRGICKQFGEKHPVAGVKRLR